MATFSDGGDGLHLFNMTGSSSYSSSSGDMRFHLQTLLDSKEKQLQQAGTLGQQLLAQRMELEERVRQIQEMDYEGGDADDVRDKYRELADTIRAWDTENEQLSTGFGSKINGTQHPSSVELSRTEIERSVERSKASATGTTAAQSSRRAKNAAHRADDVEFAFEIGSGLLTEVRRLQSLLAERDKAIQDMKEEKDDLEKSVESLRAALRQQEQSADKFKEENWNLEVTLQEIRTQLSDSQATVQRLEGEQKRLTKLLTSSREAVDQHKNEAERHQNAYMELKAKHETDVAQARRHAASLQRDKSDLQQTLDALKADAAKANRRLPRFGSPLTPNGAAPSTLHTPIPEEEDVFSAMGASTNNKKKMDTSGLFPADGFDYPDSSPEHSPSRPFLAPNHPSNEIEALQQRLAHAQRQISTLKGSLQREKELRMEYKRKLDSSAGDAEEEDEEDENPLAGTDDAKGKPRLTPFRTTKGARGKGRGRGGLTFMQRLTAHSPSSDVADEDDGLSPPEQSTATSVPPSSFRASGDESGQTIGALDTEDDVELAQSPSSRAASNRTSVDGMDPAFANVLRRSTSGRSILHGVSPLRHSVFGRPSRGRTPARRGARGGAAFQQARPPSFAGEPEALANELGELEFNSLEQTFELPEPEQIVETADFGCQTEWQEPTLPSVIVQSPSEPTSGPSTVSSTDVGIQAEPEPIQVPIAVEAYMQTDADTLPEHVEAEVQYVDPIPAPIRVSTGVATEPSIIEVTYHHEQMPRPDSAKTQIGVAELSSRQDVDIQTSIPQILSIEAHTQTPMLHVTETSVQTTESATPTPVVRRASLPNSSARDASEDTTITIRPSVLTASVYNPDDDDGTETETGSMLDTDGEEYVDARQSIALTTPTESLDDYHSILTVTDNDFSESDDESIKASRMSSRAERFSTSSNVLQYPPSELARTYESKGVSAELAVETKEEEPAPVVPLKDLAEISIQTEAWDPPIPIQSATSMLPALAPSPTLYRVGPISQQFQFISPPPSAGPTTTSLPIVATPSPNSNLRDSTHSFIPRPRTSHSDRRQSIESTLSSARDEALVRSRTPSNVASVVDKSRPPMMVLPPPPRQPPPPNSMPPPQFIPERRQPTSSTASHDGPPPRPSSPPPPELIQRATTPTFGAVLSVPASRPFGLRHHASTATASTGMRQPPSTGSFRSSATAGVSRPSHSSPSAMSFNIQERERREMSTTSLTSGGHSVESQRSSISSEHLAYDQPSNTTATVDRTVLANGANGGATDPSVIHAITQTMIGEFLYKYTRRTIGKGHGERRHKRFFWVHPYTRTLYWSSADPGSSNVSESSAKSAYIEAVRAVLDPNPMPPGIYQYSVVVSTPQREMKFTAPTKERHDIWLSALQYLLTRPGAMPVTSPASGTDALTSPMSLNADLPDTDDNHQRPGTFASPQSQRSVRTTRTGISVDSWNSTPRGQRSQSQLSLRGSVGKRAGTPAAEYLRYGGPEGPYSPTRDFEHIPGPEEGELDFELHDESMSDGGFEGLENVRACCDGRHTVGRSGKIEHHHHHHHHNHNHQPPQTQQQTLRARDNHLDPHPREIARPVSPAWSFRSRSGSTHSNDGGGFFSRFGTRRSKTMAADHR